MASEKAARENCLLHSTLMVLTFGYNLFIFGINRLLVGNICGYDPDYVEYPKMYIWDILQASKDPKNMFSSGVCVKACPNEEKQGSFIIECKDTCKYQIS